MQAIPMVAGNSTVATEKFSSAKTAMAFRVANKPNVVNDSDSGFI